MLRRIRFKPFLALNGAVDFLRWNGALFYDSVSQERRHTVEDLEYCVTLDGVSDLTI